MATIQPEQKWTRFEPLLVRAGDVPKHRPASATSIVLVFALLSGFVLGQLWTLKPLDVRPVEAVSSAQVQATTLSFYRAMNTFFEDEDDTALRQMLAPGFATRQPGGAATGDVDELFRQLDSIRRFFPGIQLTAEVTPLSSNAASVALSWNVQQRRDFAGVALDPGDLLGRNELVRIERGLIVERQLPAVLAGQLHAFPSLSIELPVAPDTLVARVMQISLQGDNQPAASMFGHMLLIDLSGEAFLEVIRPGAMPAMVWKPGRGQLAEPAPVEPEKILALGQMDAVFLPARTTFRMWDGGDQNAELLAFEFGPPVSGETPPTTPLLANLQSTPWCGVELKSVGNRLTLSFGQAQLLPGAMLSSPDVDGLELAWVTGGTLDMTGARGEARVRAASELSSQLIEGNAALQAGDTGAFGPGANATYRAGGDVPAAVWLFSLVASPDRVNAEHSSAPAGPSPLPTPPPPRNVS